MYFEIERIDKLLSELKKLIYKNPIKIENVLMKKGYYTSPTEAENSSSKWEDMKYLDKWGGFNQYCWFRFEITIPDEFNNCTVIHTIETGKENGWDATNPQFLLFINNELKKGLDINHRETIICKKAVSGQKYTIDLQAYSGMEDAFSILGNKICVLDSDTKKIYYDIKVPFDTVKMLNKEDINRINTLSYLTKTLNIIDLRTPYSSEYYLSIEKAIEYLEKNYYLANKDSNAPTVHCVGHTHIDVAWLWDLEQTRKKVQRSFSTVLDLMEEYPEYIFMSSQPQLYKFLKEDRPNLYNKVKEKIKEGRWEAEGAMWVEADCNLSSGESLVRQIIYGKRFFREEFGIENKILWLPDVFGYSAALPQILKKSGIDYFMTTKISWNEYNKLPYDTFMWEGLDGSKVLTHFITTIEFDDLPQRYQTTYNGNLNPSSVKGAWTRYQQKDINDTVLISYGYGDGGGGPTYEMLENQKRLNRGLLGCPKTKPGTAKEFFDQLNKNVSNNTRLPKWVGELYFEYHRGTLTSMARNKKYNRLSEILYEEVEWLSVFAKIYAKTDYPKDTIYNSREIIALNQFHDIIPGSSIEKVYEDSKKQYINILNKGTQLINDATSSILNCINSDTESVIVFNPLSFKRDEIVCYQDKEYFVKDIPAKGYTLVPIDDFKDSLSTMTIKSNYLENQFFKINLDNGEITSLYDKRADRQVLKKGEKGNVMVAFEDIPHNYDAWDINIYYKEKKWKVKAVSSKVSNITALKGSIIVKREYMNSVIEQEIIIYRDIPRIDFKTKIDWKENHTLLKAMFPVDVHTNKATYDIQFGNIERTTHNNTSWDFAQFEVCAHKWADLSEDNYGVALLNDCKYGYDIKDSNMNITLLKSATSPNPSADKELHEFTYSLYPHLGNWKDAKVINMGYRLNYPLIIKPINKQNGFLPSSFSLLELNKENVIAEVVKESEDEKDVVIRLYECYNRRTNVKATLPFDFKNVWECDLEENNKKEYEVNSKSFTFTINPYEIKTFRIII